MQSQVLFDSGSAQISRQGQKAIVAVAELLTEFADYIVSVEGHSDDQSIGPELKHLYSSNWDLSTARAAAAVNLLIKHGATAESILAVGHGEYQPLVPNSNAQNRKQNRRIDILLYPPVERIFVDHQ